MRTICIINNKGGVAKTTTAINLAAGLSRNDRKVLLVDLDPQSNIGLSLKVRSEHSLFDAITGKVSLQQCIVNLAANFDVITSQETLVRAEHYLATNESEKFLLKSMLSSVQGYDYVIADCPPSLGMLNQNVLAFCSEAFVPSSTDFLGFDSLRRMTAFIGKLSSDGGYDIRVTKIVPTLFDRRNRICKEMLALMQNDYPELIGHPIRMNSKLKEAPKAGKSIFSYAKNSHGAKDYARLVEEVIAMEKVAVVQET